MTDGTQKSFLVAAGGSGGHLFPAFALADELKARGHTVRVVTDHRGARFKGEDRGYPIDIITSATLGGGIIGKVKTALKLTMGMFQSFHIIRRKKIDVVIGFGGYPAFPPVFIAQKIGVPNIIHEANAVLGKANQMLAKQATKIALSLPQTKGASDVDEYKDKNVVTGNPVRSVIIEAEGAPYPERTTDDPFRIFILGGSQGARVFSDVIPAAVKLLPEDLQSKLVIYQHARPEELERTQTLYDGVTADVTLKSFFDDVPDQLAKCHLFIGRSGASTVSEVAIIGRPAIFIPMKHADMQQKVNADVITDVGGAWVIMPDDFTPQALAEHITERMKRPADLAKAAEKAAGMGQPKAAQNLADLALSVS